MGGIGLRTRLTALVTLVFAVAISISSFVVVRIVERDLVADTQADTETLLNSYLDSIYGGTPTVGVVDPATRTRFFYLDDQGNEISDQEYFDALLAPLDEEMSRLLDGMFSDLQAVPIGGSVVVGPALDPNLGPVSGVELLQIDPLTGELLDPSGAAVTFSQGPQPAGDPHEVAVGNDAYGIAQTVTLSNGTSLAIGVSSPLQPVTDSLDTMRRFLVVAVPTLIVVIAVTTWLAASRALAPVHAITRQARAITAANIGDRPPVHAARDEIHDLAATMNDMLGRLEAAQTRQRQFIADASHELRSPVAASRAQLEVAAANPNRTDWEATAATVLVEQEHLGHLIDSLLALSRLDETGAETREDVDLDDLVAAEAARPHLTPVSADVANPVRVVADGALVARALRNLVDNAARHAAGQVTVTLHRDGDQAVIDVDDDGPGIPADQRERVLDRFTRVDEARDRQRGGAGLGLAIAREVMRVHNGELGITDSPLGGARVTMSLPLGSR